MPAPGVAALAATLDRACFAERSGVDRSGGADDALAAAVDALVDAVDALGADVAAAVGELLTDVRHGRIPRIAARHRAKAALRHLAGALDAERIAGPAEPLVVLLGALAALSADVREETFHLPVLGIEDAGDAGLGIRFLPLVVDDAPMICAFTSPDRFTDLAVVAGIAPAPLLELDAAELAALCPAGHGVVVDPGSVLGRAFVPGAPTRATGPAHPSDDGRSPDGGTGPRT